MNIPFRIFVVPAVFVAGCASTFPASRRSASQTPSSAQRSAREVGAAGQPAAQLHLKLADEQMVLAKREMANGDNRAADFVLIRARADFGGRPRSGLREQNATVDIQRAVDTSNTTATTNAIQGAVK